MTLLFVYGTLKRNYSLNAYMVDSKFICIGKLDNYALYNTGLPFVVEEKNESVIGEVYDINDYTFKQLDRLEGSYIKKVEKIRVNNVTFNAYVYIQIDKKGEKIKSGIF